MTSDKTLTRRRYSETKKAQVLAECCEPGASVAKVALAHGINANIVHRWRQLAREGAVVTPAKPPAFIALPLAAPTGLRTAAPAAAATDIRIELHRGALALSITWPVSAAPELAAWTRELLR
ncbi:IS66-like element accessory protein TnpA [Roseateles sp.]|jgi:transposase|uniref:IS66-like element accessory protein TnpA n=1 Tax=Roseateles sp. TaxID=1971397 RepID=UPI003BA7E0BD